MRAEGAHSGQVKIFKKYMIKSEYEHIIKRGITPRRYSTWQTRLTIRRQPGWSSLTHLCVAQRIVVDVFGIHSKSVGGSSCCTGGCGLTPTMGELFDDLANFIDNSEVKNKEVLQFIDVMEDDIEYETVKRYWTTAWPAGDGD